MLNLITSLMCALNIICEILLRTHTLISIVTLNQAVFAVLVLPANAALTVDICTESLLDQLHHRPNHQRAHTNHWFVCTRICR